MQYFTAFVVSAMDVPVDTPPPAVDIKGPVNGITLCSEIKIEVFNPRFDGNRPLEIISWELANVDAGHDPIVLGNIDSVLLTHTL